MSFKSDTYFSNYRTKNCSSPSSKPLKTKPVMTCSKSATTDNHTLASHISLFSNNIIRPSLSLTSNKKVSVSPSKQSRRQSLAKSTTSSLAKVVPSLSKKITDKKEQRDTLQQDQHSRIDSSTNNRQRRYSSVNGVTSLVSTYSTNKSIIDANQQQTYSTEYVSYRHHNGSSSICPSSSQYETATRNEIYTPACSSQHYGRRNNNNNARYTHQNKNGYVLNTTVPPSTSATLSKQTLPYRRLSRDISGNEHIPQHRRPSSSLSTNRVKQNKTETPSSSQMPRLQNSRKPLRRAATLVTSPRTPTLDSDSDPDEGTILSMDHQTKEQSRLLHCHHQSIIGQQQRRTSIAITNPITYSSASTSSLTRRRSFADVSSKSVVPPSTPSHHDHHHKQNQSRLRHPSWLDSAGFMRRSKCSACNPSPPSPTRVISPPNGIGVPTFGPPLDTSVVTKHPSTQRSSSRCSQLHEKNSKNDHTHVYGYSSSLDSVDNNGRHNSKTSMVDNISQIQQTRRLSSPNLGSTDYSYTRSPKRNIPDKRLSIDRPVPTSTKTVMDVSSRPNIIKQQPLRKKAAMTPTKKTRKDSFDTPHDIAKVKSPSTLSSDKSSTTPSPSCSSATSSNADSPPTNDSSSSAINTYVMKHGSAPAELNILLSQLMEPKYLKTLTRSASTEKITSLDELPPWQQTSPLPTEINDKQQCGGLIKKEICALQQLQQFLASTAPSTPTMDSNNNSNNEEEEEEEERYSSSDISIYSSSDKHHRAVCTSPSSLSLESDHIPKTTENQKEKPTSSVLSDLEQWTARVRFTLNCWFADLSHGQMDRYEVDQDGTITTMTITGYAITLEASLFSHLPNASTIDTATKHLFQHRYSLQLGKEERMYTFIVTNADAWIPDDQVTHCQFKTKSTRCECEFDWMNRRHHCRRCGNIFCKTHSSNRLPLFEKGKPDIIQWSRVCDVCCYQLVGSSLILS